MSEGRKLLTEVDEEFSMIKEAPPGLIRLDLACGQSKREGFTGVDIKPGCSDLSFDLMKSNWPIADNSVYEVYCSHFVEHVSDLRTFMSEVYRVLCPHGIASIIGPYYSSERAWQDFTHVRALTQLTFRYFDQTWLKQTKLDHYEVDVDFEPINVALIFDPSWAPRGDEAKAWAMKHYINVVSDIKYVLRAIKPIRSS